MILLQIYLSLGVLTVAVSFLGGALQAHKRGVELAKLPATILMWLILLLAWPPFLLRKERLKASMLDAFPLAGDCEPF